MYTARTASTTQARRAVGMSALIKAAHRSGVVMCLVGLLLPMVVVLGGCDDSTTRVSYQTPVAPLGISLARNADGDWTVAAGIATSVGMFGIEHTFVAEGGYAYLVIRDRKKGTDQVFKMATDGYLTAHAVGDHYIRMSREGKKWVIDIDTVEGTLDIKVYPNSSEIAHIVFSSAEPTITVSTDQTLTIKPPGWFTSKQKVSLDSVAQVEWSKSLLCGPTELRLKYKDKVAESPTVIPVVHSAKVDGDYAILKGAVKEINPDIKFVETAGYQPGPKAIFFLLLALCAGGLASAAFHPAHHRDARHKFGWGAAALAAFALLCLYGNGAAKNTATAATAMAIGIPIALVHGVPRAKKWVEEDLIKT